MQKQKSGMQPVNRRTILKSIGGTAALGVGSVGGVSGAKTELLNGRIAGVTYDTLTHEAGKPAFGRVIAGSNGLQGRLDVAGFSIPLDALKTEPAPMTDLHRAIHSADFDQREFQRDDLPLRVRIREYDNYLSGIISRPSTRFGELGFYALGRDQIDVEEATASRIPDPKWKESNLHFEVPDKGLPTDSATRRLHKFDSSAAEIGGDR